MKRYAFVSVVILLGGFLISFCRDDSRTDKSGDGGNAPLERAPDSTGIPSGINCDSSLGVAFDAWLARGRSCPDALHYFISYSLECTSSKLALEEAVRKSLKLQCKLDGLPGLSILVEQIGNSALADSLRKATGMDPGFRSLKRTKRSP